MPEYLAPAVYVEEVDTGSKPIEGVSTSTAGMIGVTERGPVNVPILVTSFGEYQRWFGQMLNAALYGEHRFLPHSVEGYFTNGGKRTYVTRILDPGAALPATRRLYQPSATPLTGHLLLPARVGDSDLVLADTTGWPAVGTLQIGDGANVEYRDISAAITAPDVLALRLPLAQAHTTTDVIHELNAALTGTNTTLDGDTDAGADVITLTSAAGFAENNVIRVGVGAVQEFAIIAAQPAGNTIVLRAPLAFAHNDLEPVSQINGAVVGASVAVDAARVPVAGDTMVAASAGLGAFATGDLIGLSSPTGGNFDPTSANAEVRVVGDLSRFDLRQPLSLAVTRGNLVQLITLGVALPAVNLTVEAAAYSTVITVSDRTGLVAGGALAIGVGPTLEYAEIAGLPSQLSPSPVPDPGRIVLRAPLVHRHSAALGVVTGRPITPTLSTVTALGAAVGETGLTVADDGGALAVQFIRIVSAQGAQINTLTASAASLTPSRVPLNNPLVLPHQAAEAVRTCDAMMVVTALDAGRWGNRLRVAMELQETPVLNTRVRAVLASGMRLNSAAGVEPGTELRITDSLGARVPVKVTAIDRNNDYLLTLAAPLPPTVLAGNVVRSVEYRVVVELRRQEDPANPARNNAVIDREVFPALSLDPVHSRYYQRVIGCTWNLGNPATTLDNSTPPRPLRRADRRSDGESAYVRVFDLIATSNLQPSPLASYEARPGSIPKLVLLPLDGGDDQLPPANDDTLYVGNDHIDPDMRTGLHTLRNFEEISIIAAPGRTSVRIQGALINHCELMRYRFVALDGMPPPGDSMTDIQTQRQQFDTKYAALYHPWLLIPAPYPTNPAAPADYPIPPVGHVLGIYARTDIERGVHKAPANEVVRGVTGLQRLLNKEQHDILNPYPVNINVIRDFRPNNRGIRVYGGRCITSDSDWKYVNVRRLLIFIEASVDRGLQWVVFEPNAEPLWARVRRAISNFLTLVWRNGALEGTKVEEAFFVKCDRTTMTQTDIDQGRLICLVGVAPVKPAEFVIVRIGLWTAHAED